MAAVTIWWLQSLFAVCSHLQPRKLSKENSFILLCLDFLLSMDSSTHRVPRQFLLLYHGDSCFAIYLTYHSLFKKKKKKKDFYPFEFISTLTKFLLRVFFSFWCLVPGVQFLYQVVFLVQFSSVAQSCMTLCDPTDCSMPGFPVHHQLLEITQTHIHWVGAAIQPSHLLLSPSLPPLNLPQHQGLFKWVNSSHEVAKVLEFQLQH